MERSGKPYHPGRAKAGLVERLTYVSAYGVDNPVGSGTGVEIVVEPSIAHGEVWTAFSDGPVSEGPMGDNIFVVRVAP